MTAATTVVLEGAPTRTLAREIVLPVKPRALAGRSAAGRAMQTADALIVGGGGREMDARLPCVLWLECGAGGGTKDASVSFLEEFDVALS